VFANISEPKPFVERLQARKEDTITLSQVNQTFVERGISGSGGGDHPNLCVTHTENPTSKKSNQEMSVIKVRETLHGFVKKVCSGRDLGGVYLVKVNYFTAA
jgi:hypothetical protein